MRKSIFTSCEIFITCYKKIQSLLSEGMDIEKVPKELESTYLPKEIKLFLYDLGLLKRFIKVDKIQIVYRILSIIVLLQFLLNFLFLIFFASLANDTSSANVDFTFLSMPILLSLVGIAISTLLVINSFWENIISTVIIFISFLFFSQIYNETFIIFKSSSFLYWIPVVFFLLVFILTIRMGLPKRERLLKLIKKFNKCGMDIASIPEGLAVHSHNKTEFSIFKLFSKAPDPKLFFKNLPYKVMQNPTESELIKWIYKKKRNNKILLVLTGVFILFIIVFIVFNPYNDYSVYEMLQFILVITIFFYLIIKNKSLKNIDDDYISQALINIKNKSIKSY